MNSQNYDYIRFGKQIQWLRTQAGLSQKALAEKLGMPQQTYQGYESGKRKVTLQLLKQFADFFDVSIDFLANRNTDENLEPERPKLISKTAPSTSVLNNITKPQSELLAQFNKLNNLGKNEANKRVEELTYIEKYTNKPIDRQDDCLMPIAAHSDAIKPVSKRIIDEIEKHQKTLKE